MKLIPLIATKETINVKNGGIVTYETDKEIDQEGILLMANETGEYGLVIVNQIHKSGPVKVSLRPIVQPAKKFALGETVAFLAVF